ncbi:acyl CoA:acetate/3-ketoacid CoA transferase [Vagococcus fluvialis]|jgi:propionate CoA-transferase|uniref:acyl CoA:acetate/3-ketoacid CoA transferase n=1 Tax=Vagococcus fluvialis TaxID=2738 RepID=UPI001D09F7F5|nr:CoA-transferase [Vagococcus fluvialis]UDM74129.1 3-oxoacid CoA-transferase [Vagococcus fluvialis]UDM78712.1 3-oxoacid CoA-transferase [Vagococcus fluvialis]
MSVKFITANKVPELIQDGDILGIEGFIGSGAAEEIYQEIGSYYSKHSAPKNLTLLYSAGIGDGGDRGINWMAKEHLLKRVIAGHWGLSPKLQPLVSENKIEAYNFPQGVIAQMFREMAAGKDYLFSSVGLGTFIDPDISGGKLNNITTEDLVEKINFKNKELLAYSLIKPSVAILRGTYADEKGNISFDEEVLTLGCTSLATAVKNNGGTVIVQVKRKVKSGSLDPRLVKIPGLLVDYVVECSDESNHMQTYATSYNADFIHSNTIQSAENETTSLNERKIIARRSAELIPSDAKIVNYGIGVPEVISSVLKEEGINDNYTTTIEPGSFGGIPQGGMDFGAAVAPDAIIDQAYMFDFYDGGGIDIAFLGLAECDKDGNINVSKFGPKIAGCGGFINITQSTKNIVFCGTFTAGGLKTKIDNEQIVIEHEGKKSKFVDKVEQITFSGKTAIKNEQNVYYVTERAVFKLTNKGVELIEIAPGIDLQKDILSHMSFKPLISEDLKLMSSAIFKKEKMALSPE